jgi:serine/threonine-protein kinase
VGVFEPEIIGGRYAIFDEIASGGMASVHFCCSVGAGRFSRVVAMKRLHAHLADEHELMAMFIDEARLAARIRHPNVVPTLDVVTTERELFLVLEYVHGESLSRLLRELRKAGECLPPRVACAIVVGALHGLHAAHEAVDEHGESLRIVHRDVSPQNILVGTDGIPRVVDFGIAHANDRLQTSAVGQIKGKCMYMAPEYITGKQITRAADVYSAGVVLWEALTGKRLFTGESETQILSEVLHAHVNPPGHHARDIPPELDAIVLRALDRDPAMRFGSAREMIRAIESAIPIATATEVGDWVEALAGGVLTERARTIARIESGWAVSETGTYTRRLLHALSRGRRPQVAGRDAARLRSMPSAVDIDVDIPPPDPTVGPAQRKALRTSRTNRLVLLAALIAVVAAAAVPVWLRVLHRGLPWRTAAVNAVPSVGPASAPPSPASGAAAALSFPPPAPAPAIDLSALAPVQAQPTASAAETHAPASTPRTHPRRHGR